MKGFPNESESYAYHYRHPSAQRPHQHQYNLNQNYNEYDSEACSERNCGCKETTCAQCTTISTEVGNGSECSVFSLLPICLVSGVVALAVVLLVSASVLYIQYLPSLHTKASINEKPCERMYCAYGAQCIVDEATKQAYCRCAERCNPEIFAPVCGNDGITYSSVCQMNIRSCSEQRRIFIKHTGSCDMKDPCHQKECRFGAQCKPTIDGRNAECVCPTVCATYGDSRGSRPVCGTDGRDYPNVCELRRHSCKGMKEITVKFTGACDPCDGVECPASQICQLDDHRNPICRCNAVCNQDFKPVCGSDGKTYTNECILRVEGCKARRSLRIIHSGGCGDSNPCATLQCTQFQECEIDRYGIATCQCPPPCPTILRPVCGSDGENYDSECDLQRQACLLHKDIHLKHSGICGDDGPCSKNSNFCQFGAICVMKPNGEPACECPTCSEEFKPICGSDGISYPNECKMRRELCEQKKSVEISFTEGLCNGCENKNCEFYSVCESDGQGGQCICPQSCVHIESPVCGSDGVTYDNECQMRVSACKQAQYVTVATRGPCDVCHNVHCKYGARCENGRCVCPTECPDVYEPICGSDGVTYVSECEMKSASCRQSTDISVKFYGECDEIVGSGSGSGGYTKVCDSKTCRYGGVCDYDENGVPHCVCTYHCPPSGHDSEPVCGSDGRLYDNECKLQEEACGRQQEIKPQDMKMCEEVKILACDGEPPLVNPMTRKEYFCGEGPDSKTCPPNSYCHKGSNFAKCCREVVTVKSCVETTYGCCPDGKTAAQGVNSAGCPSVCGCQRLGSYSSSCDPTTKQCHCKPGVGGIRCDRCEAGFWGLHKISDNPNLGNSGCIPCACNEFGSSRDDCEQMTGRCVCKVGIQGMKCDVCPEGMVLGPEGCTDASLTRTLPGSCADIKCHFGAVCKVRVGRGVQCVCDMKCSNDSQRKHTSVCGSDGNTYGSECQLRLFSCRYQKRITATHEGQCKSTTSETGVTAGPVRRSTVFKTTQDTEKSTREVSLHENMLMSTGPTVPTHTLPEVIPTPVETPAFDGMSYIELPRLQAYTRLTLELEFKTYETNGILLYNGQTLSGEGDFASLAIKDLHIEFRYNLGSGTVILRSNLPIQLGKHIKVVAKRYLWDGMLSVEGQEDVSGKSQGALKSLDLTENLFLGYIPSKEKRIYENIGMNKGLVGCVLKFRIGRKDIDLNVPESKDIIKFSNIRECNDANPCHSIPCLNGATCLPQKESYKCFCDKQFTGKQCETPINACSSNPCTAGATCIVLQNSISDDFVCKCPNGRTGKLCADLQREMFVVKVPDFWGTSFLQLPTLQGVSQAFTIEVWFLSRAIHGMILYNGQQASGKGDFLSLNINDGFVQFRYDLGSGIANVSGIVSISSENPITLGEWHSIRITRKRKVGTLQLDDGPIVEGESKGSLNELNLEQPLYIGGVENMYAINRDSGIMIGLNGAIQRIVVNGEVWDNLVQRAVKHRNVPEYLGPPCGSDESPCLNGGICMAQLNDYICKCSAKYTGKKCDKLMEREDLNKPVSFKGNTFLMFANKIITVDDNHSTESGEVGVEGQRENRFEITFRTTHTNGIILWLNKGGTAQGDYLSLAVSDGFLELSFNLGKQKELLILKSISAINDGHWHTVLVNRNKRLGVMQIDNQQPISGTSEPGATELNTDGVLWIGGSPGLPTGLPTQYYQGFNGCIGSVKVDGETLQLTSHTTASNLEFCSIP